MGKEAKFVVRLNDAERQSLQDLLAGKRVAADKILRARMVTNWDTSWGKSPRLSGSSNPPGMLCVSTG